MLQDDGGALGGDVHARLVFMAPVAGTYYVRIRNTGDPGSTYYRADGEYCVTGCCAPLWFG
jgi:hypothetical protein